MHDVAHEVGQRPAHRRRHDLAAVARLDVAVAHPEHDVRADERAAVDHRRVGGHQLELGDRDALPERAVRDVGLAPVLERRVAHEARRLAGDVHAGPLPEAEPEPGPGQDLGRLRRRAGQAERDPGGADVARVGDDVARLHPAVGVAVGVVDPAGARSSDSEPESRIFVDSVIVPVSRPATAVNILNTEPGS